MARRCMVASVSASSPGVPGVEDIALRSGPFSGNLRRDRCRHSGGKDMGGVNLFAPHIGSFR